MSIELEQLRTLINDSIDTIIATSRRKNKPFPSLELPADPSELSPETAGKKGFTGPLIHTRYFKANIERLLSAVQPGSEKPIVVIGCGKSAQEYVFRYFHASNSLTDFLSLT